MANAKKVNPDRVAETLDYQQSLGTIEHWHPDSTPGGDPRWMVKLYLQAEPLWLDGSGVYTLCLALHSGEKAAYRRGFK